MVSFYNPALIFELLGIIGYHEFHIVSGGILVKRQAADLLSLPLVIACCAKINSTSNNVSFFKATNIFVISFKLFLRTCGELSAKYETKYSNIIWKKYQKSNI